jgi:uncharacterized membrane protein YdfJ with MMPL/SSD domain
MRDGNGLAARAGRWSAQHRFKAITGWLAFVIAATALGGAVGTRTLEGAEYGVGESKQADLALERAFPASSGETVLIQSRSSNPDQEALRKAVRETSSALRGTDGVGAVRDPFAPGGGGRPISPDRRSALVQFELDGAGAEDPEWTEIVTAPLQTVADLDASHPAFSIEQFGDASAEKALGKVFEDDFRKAEVTSLPTTLIVLVIAFGALAAAFVPLLLAITAVTGAIGVIAIVSQFWPVDEAVGSVVLLIGLAVGVDYSMFYLRREREERARGLGPEAALEAAASTSGRAVLVSGFTVMIAMAGMYLSGASTFTSFATGTILVVGMAVVGSLTVLPAVLSKLGDRVNKGRIPFLRRPEQRAGSEPRLWGAIVDRVMRRPLFWGGLAAAVLVLMSVPTLGLKTAVPGIDSLPQDVEVVQNYNKIDAAFPGNEIPATVVIEASDANSRELKAAIGELRSKTSASALYGGPASVEASPDGSAVRVDVPLTGDGADRRSERGLARLRDGIVPATVGAVPGAESNVTGFTAGSVDFNRVMSDHVPLVFAFVLGMAFLLLLLTFRSIVIPIKAIVLNLLSVGASYGLVVWIFQQGHLQSLLGFESSGAVVSWLPMFLFVILFGLSMDYHVFILSRIREAVNRGMSSADAVGHGIKSTAGVVTAAAIVMVAVFSIFATLSALEFKQFGVGLGAAILIDATIVRGVLLPASMRLLGDWNWYLPRRLEWLPRIGREPRHEPGPARESHPAPDRAPEPGPEPAEA